MTTVARPCHSQLDWESRKTKRSCLDPRFHGDDKGEVQICFPVIFHQIKTPLLGVHLFGGRYRIRTYHLHNVNVAL